jgi:hypothetical protein
VHLNTPWVTSNLVGKVATASAGTVITPTALVYAVLTRIAAAWAIASVLLAVTVQVRRRAQIRVFPGF